MDFYIVIPCHNESAFIGQTLASLVAQTHLPKKVVVVNDQSTDNSAEIVSAFAKAHSYIHLLNITSSDKHLPGSKVINAFYKGFESLDDEYDVICKYDADLIFPPNYLEKVNNAFTENNAIGMAGGFCYIEKDGNWELENLTNKDHIRGALKAYRKACFKDIGGIKKAMGWDTIDELLAKYHKWEIHTDGTLHVKHLKPTGNTYNKSAQYKQGEAFYGMRYGLILTLIASSKLAKRKGNIKLLKDYLSGYLKAKAAKKEYLVTPQEGDFIRTTRWSGIRKKLGL
ncbi:glycosyltransferase family 2 protein [Dokdonia genika]|uniref:Glycosyltransferase family 2 protein n=1 Tax=Dokdonia genika TaxID=308113 RepID=A0ABV9L816_9FLAO